MKPMLAVQCDTDNIPFPVYASPKLDGIRAVVSGGVLLSRKLKPIPNNYTQDLFGIPFLEGLDGELCVGPPNAKDLMQRTTSGVMSHDGEPDVTFYVFDYWTDPAIPFSQRHTTIAHNAQSIMSTVPRVKVLEQRLITHNDALLMYEAECLAKGYEGVMLRKHDSRYKYGRSTLREGVLLKLKRFSDGEAVVIGVEELMHNANELQSDEMGYAKRSNHQANLVPMGTLGSLVVRDVATGVEFSIGTGYTAAHRAELWALRDTLPGMLVKYKHFDNAGVKVAPRFPVYLGFRNPLDMS